MGHGLTEPRPWRQPSEFAKPTYKYALALRKCPRCGRSAPRCNQGQRTLHDLGNVRTGRPIDIVIAYSKHRCPDCRRCFNADMADLAREDDGPRGERAPGDRLRLERRRGEDRRDREPAEESDRGGDA